MTQKILIVTDDPKAAEAYVSKYESSKLDFSV